MTDTVFGRRPVLELLKNKKRSAHKIWVAQGTHRTEDILTLARERGVPVEFVPRHDLDRRVAANANHQGVVAQASAAPLLSLEDVLAGLDETPAVLVALDEIQDPHNVGAILRSAGFFGVSGAVVPKWRNAPVGDTAARVSSGAIEHVPLIRVTNLAQAIMDVQEAGFQVIGADMAGEPIDRYVPGKRSMIVFGSEGEGLRRLVKERCDKLLAVRGAGQVNSLNVSATAAIFLHHFCRVR